MRKFLCVVIQRKDVLLDWLIPQRRLSIPLRL